MTLHIDSHFTIGQGHTICEDYSYHKLFANERQGLVLISDGCSAGDNVDIGARLLVHSAEPLFVGAIEASETKHLFELNLEPFYIEAANRGMLHTKALGLGGDAMLASLGTLFTSDGRWKAGMFGDGVIAAKRKDGSIIITSIEFSRNCPAYPIYKADGCQTLEDVLENNKKIITVNKIEGGDVTEWKYQSFDFLTEITGDASDHEFVAIMTDGIHTFNKPNPENPIKRNQRLWIHIARLFPELTKFNNLKDDFVQRKISNFKERKKDWEHYDDLTLGVIHFGRQGK